MLYICVQLNPVEIDLQELKLLLINMEFSIITKLFKNGP